MNKIFSLILILLFYGPVLAQWETVSTMPIPVKGAKAIVQDTVIYIIGGVSDSLLLGTKKIQAYYPESNRWEVLQDTIIVPRFGLSLESYGDSAYFFGGAKTGNDSSYSIEKWGFHDKPKIKEFNPNFNRSFASTAMVGSDLFIFGGYPADFELFDSLSYIVRINMEDGNVMDSFSINDSFAVEMPSHQMSAVMNDKVYLFGGTLTTILRKISYLDLTNDSWIELDITLNKPRASGVALPHPNGEEIILIGGKNEGSEALRLVETFNINSYMIIDKQKMSIARSQHTAVIYKDVIYVFGGKNAENIIVGDVERINLDSLDNDVTNISGDTEGYLDTSFELVGNYPNPFNPQTSIIVNLNKAQHLAIDIYDIQGRKIKSLYNNIMTQGRHAISWDATDDSQQSVTSGIYFYTVSSGDIIKTNRMLFIK